MKWAGGSLRAGLVRWKRSARWLGRRPVLRWSLVVLLFADLLLVPNVKSNVAAKHVALLFPICGCVGGARDGVHWSFDVIKLPTGWEIMQSELEPYAVDVDAEAMDEWFAKHMPCRVRATGSVTSFGLVAPIFIERSVSLGINLHVQELCSEMTPAETVRLRSFVIDTIAMRRIDGQNRMSGQFVRGRFDAEHLGMLRSDVERRWFFSWAGFTHDCLFVMGAVWVLAARRWARVRRAIRKRERAKRRAGVLGVSVGTGGGNGAEGANR